jgi:hypothetical protein
MSQNRRNMSTAAAADSKASAPVAPKAGGVWAGALTERMARAQRPVRPILRTTVERAVEEWLRRRLSKSDFESVRSVFGACGVVAVSDLPLLSRTDLVEMNVSIGCRNRLFNALARDFHAVREHAPSPADAVPCGPPAGLLPPPLSEHKSKDKPKPTAGLLLPPVKEWAVACAKGHAMKPVAIGLHAPARPELTDTIVVCDLCAEVIVDPALEPGGWAEDPAVERTTLSRMALAEFVTCATCPQPYDLCVPCAFLFASTGRAAGLLTAVAAVAVH